MGVNNGEEIQWDFGNQGLFQFEQALNGDQNAFSLSQTLPNGTKKYVRHAGYVLWCH